MNQFAKARIEAKISQEEAATSLNVDRSTVAKWETDVAKPRAERLPAIAKLYNCTVETLLSGEAAVEKAEKAV